MIYFYYRDKFEKEPVKTLMKAFFAGMLSVLLTVISASILSFPLTETGSPVYEAFVKSFWEAAIPEEISKFVLLYIFIWKDKNFNEYYDGIIYSVFVALGFAGVENIMYVMQGGIGIAISRALLSVPLHALCGVIMGYYLSLAKFNLSKKTIYFLTGIFWAIVAHGTYDFIIFYLEKSIGISEISALISTVLVFVFIILFWKVSLKKINIHVNNSVFKNKDDELV